MSYRGKVFTAMKNTILLVLTLVGLAVLAEEPKNVYDVRCPTCLAKQQLPATTVASNGGYSTNFNGVTGTMSTQTGAFHCPECHSDFMAQIKPDRFVPTFYATHATNAVTPVNAPKKAATATPLAPGDAELIRTVQLPDGTELLVYRRRIK